MRRAWWILIASLSLTACINITTRLLPEDVTVKETVVGSDCVPIIFGFAYGTADVTKAMRAGSPAGEQYGSMTVTKVRRTDLWDFMLLWFGARCVEVSGEPAPQTAGATF